MSMTTARPESHSPPSSGRPRSLITRITAPFQPRMRHISDLQIETTDPHRVYSPGDAVKGVIKFTTNKPLRITHVVLQTRGFVKVYRSPTPPGRGISAEAAAYSSLSGRKGAFSDGAGFATICENEEVVCGSGNLSIARYELPFSVSLPRASLPSSLDFERGTISYVLTAIITRPTAVAPTIAAERKIEVREVVDVANMSDPQQRTLTHKPHVKRPRGRGPSTNERDRASAAALPSANASSSEREPARPRRSASMSEWSATSGQSSARALPASADAADAGHAVDSENPQAIKVLVEILREGYLPGDNVPVRVMVKHTMPVTAMQGVIVTLYRRASIELLPDSAYSKDGGTRYSSSRARGLSGLFLGTGVTGHIFRYDLDQTIAPLIINPNTMQGETKTSIRIPDDVFPSITTVPHGLMSFTYHIEVVMDLMGKLSGMDRLLPRLSMTRTSSRYGFNAAAEDYTAHGASSTGTRILDTSSLRRIHSIAHCTFEVVVGTKDSCRQPPKRAADPWADVRRLFSGPESTAQASGDRVSAEEVSVPGGSQLDTAEQRQSPRPEPAQVIIPPPETEPAPTNEKEALRRAEEQLLPSQPPEAGPSNTSGTPPVAPSAPVLTQADAQSPMYVASPAAAVPPAALVGEDDDVNEKERMRRHEAALLPSAPEDTDEDDSTAAAGPSASAPASESVDGSSASFMLPLRRGDPRDIAEASGSGVAAPPYTAEGSGSRQHVDDKQELERRRLLAEASAPDDQEEEEDADEPTPSAPRPDDDGDDVSDRATWERVDGVENLPRYQR